MADGDAGAAPVQTADVPEARVDDAAEFEQRLTREILISERLRVTLLALIPGVSMLLFLAASAASPELMQKAFDVQLDRLRIGLFLGGISTYEFFSLNSVEKLLKTGRAPPAHRRYINAFIETSLPTIVILYYMAVVGPVEALLLPPTLTYFVFILLSTLRLDFILCVFTGLVAAVEYAVLAFIAITAGAGPNTHAVLTTIPHHLAKAAILFVSGVAAGFVARRLRRSFVNTLRSVEDRNRIVNVFGQHVSPAVVERLIAEKADVKSETREVCVMFVDIRNFTAFSENKSPEEVVGYLNALFEIMVESVNAHHGIVNKFLGDGFMAIFGAPIADGNHARHAVDAGLDIVARVEAEVALGRFPPTRLGVGVHAGRVVIGNVGSRHRKEYTVIGDAVNLASRVEALNKELGSKMLVTEEVWKAGGREVIDAVAQAPLTVRGRKAPIQIYRLA